MITWTKITDKTNLPTKEVFATDSFGEYLFGTLSYDPEFDDVMCEDENTLLSEVTHYSEVNPPI